MYRIIKMASEVVRKRSLAIITWRDPLAKMIQCALQLYIPIVVHVRIALTVKHFKCHFYLCA